MKPNPSQHQQPKTKQYTTHLPKKQHGSMMLSFILLVILFVGLVFLGLYIVKQNRLIVTKFQGKQWNIPAKVYSRPLELYQGKNLSGTELSYWLNLISYRQANSYKTTGTFTHKNGEYFIHTRPFDFSNEQKIPQQILKIKITDNKIEAIQSTQPNQQKVYLEPVLIGGIYPDNNEDRIVMDLKNVPKQLLDALIATEDRAFYDHHGISVRGTARAFYSNITGGKRQGGSTITQQLVKNFYLNSDRTIKRKANEALMALILEYHYSKEDILQTYINEINLGQNGNHSINGFGLAAQFYFARPLNELRLDQLAFLVGLAKGPSQYNPFPDIKAGKIPKMALERRNVVLNNMLVMGKIDQKTYDEAIKKPLDVVRKPIIGKSRFPDYLDIVKRELNKTYYAEDLKNEGLKIFTSFDPNVQRSADSAVQEGLNQLKGKNPNVLKNLQSALVSANPNTGELLAVVGSSSEFTGFNRAVDAKRQVGSLLKPIIYLTAFEEGDYNLASGVQDSLDGIQGLGAWSPNNYSGRDYGTVPLITALANSYNKSAVRVGMEVGVPKFINQLYRMGITTKLPDYPSTLLGAVDLSPMDMLGIYQVLATGGIKYDIHTIRSVVDNQGRVIQQNNTNKPKQVISPTATYLTNHAMQAVIKNGTAKSAVTTLGESLNLAGKTGTTNDARDAWFAGYSGNYVTVVWLGLDDNQPIDLTGGTGALPIWTNYMKRLHLSPVNLPQPNTIEWRWLENGTGRLSKENCPDAIYLPIDTNHRPQENSDCSVADYRQSQQERFEQQQKTDAEELYASQSERLNKIEETEEAPTDEVSEPSENTETDTSPVEESNENEPVN